MNIWPFKPRERMTEVLAWLTDVIQTRNKEQRFSQRELPRIEHNLSYFLTVEEYAAAQALIRQNQDFLFPDWALSVSIGFIPAGVAESIPYNLPYAGLDIGDQILIWESSSKYEAVEILDTDSADTYIGDISRDYENARLIPLFTARLPNGLEVSKRAGNNILVSVNFEISKDKDVGPISLPQYRGIDVITDCPVIASENFSEPISWPVDTFDSEVADPVYTTARGMYSYRRMLRWHVRTREALYSLKQLVYSRKGRQRAFWAPSFSRDFRLVQDIGASDTEILVYPPAGILDLGVDSFNIEINGIYLRQVTNYQTTYFLGQPVIRFFLDSSLGQAISLGARVSMLYLMRFDADRVEFEYVGRVGVSVAIPIIEINEL